MELNEQYIELRRLVEVLRQEQVLLQRENEDLQAENKKLREEIERLQGENEKLKQQLEQEGKAAPPSFVKANKPKKAKQTRRKRAPEANKGRRRQQPTRYEVHQIEMCPDCGEKLSAGSCYYRREVVDIPALQPVEVVEHRVMKGWCWHCRCWQRAEVDWRGVVVGKGRIGVRLTGIVAYMRATLRLPIRTIQQYLETVYQVQLSVGGISNLCQRAVRHMADESGVLLAAARASPTLYMDETGWREDGQNGYIWCLATDTPHPIRYFEYHQSRAGAVAEEMLGGFAGHLVTDFYGAYNKYLGPHQRCWVHLLRDLRQLREKHASQGEIVAWAAGVKGLYHYAHNQLATDLSAAEQETLYQTLWQMTHQFGLMYATTRDHPCCVLAKRLLRHVDELFQFVLHDNVAADNNLAERTLRPLVVQRKISGGSRTPAGSQTRMMLASFFETWKAQQLNPLLECWRQLGYVLDPALP